MVLFYDESLTMRASVSFIHPVPCYEVRWDMVCGLLSVCLGDVAVPSHDVPSAAYITNVADYVIYHTQVLLLSWFRGNARTLRQGLLIPGRACDAPFWVVWCDHYSVPGDLIGDASLIYNHRMGSHRQDSVWAQCFTRHL